MNLFFLLNQSFWPFICSFGTMSLMVSFIMFFKMKVMSFMFFNLFFLVVFSSLWWIEIHNESKVGNHTNLSLDNLKLGMLFFILSEVCFFGGFFWSFFHYSFVPSIDLGEIWPPFSLVAINPFSVPLLNTIVLLSSGATVTLSHMNLVNNYKGEFSLAFTLLLGFYFTLLQVFEYYMSGFTMSDTVYGSIFFIATGFHGVHVLVGSIFLLICLIRLLLKHFSMFNHLGYEMAIWYWHFVDVVWLFLFSFIYWWSF